MEQKNDKNTCIEECAIFFPTKLNYSNLVLEGYCDVLCEYFENALTLTLDALEYF